jgi:hypothetical protein
MAKEFDMKKNMVLPRVLKNASIIQQLGLDTEKGFQRLFMILLHYADPERKGITLDLDTINVIVDKMANKHQNQLLVEGKDDKIFIKALDAVELYMHQKENK